MSKQETPHPPAPENFLGRWARLKQQNTPHTTENPPILTEETVETTEIAKTAENTENVPAPASVSAHEDTTETPVLTDADMPPLETLDEKSDYSGFFSAGVSEELRKLALRKLFHTPTFNIRDGLDDYDDDYTQFAALGDIITSDMKHQMKVEARRMLEKLEKETRAQPITANDPAEEAMEKNMEEAMEETADTTPVEEVETATETKTTETTEEKPA